MQKYYQQLLALCMSIFIATCNAQETTPSAPCPDSACLMIVAESSRICVELYALHDLQPIMEMRKKERHSHCIFQLAMAERGMGLLNLQWHTQKPGYMSIQAGKKGSPTTYCFDLFSLFTLSESSLHQPVVHCLEGNLVPLPEIAQSAAGEMPNQWKSCIQLKLSNAENQEIVWLFDNRIKGACFVITSASIFQQAMRYNGKMKKSDALACNLLTIEQQAEESIRIETQETAFNTMQTTSPTTVSMPATVQETLTENIIQTMIDAPAPDNSWSTAILNGLMVPVNYAKEFFASIF